MKRIRRDVGPRSRPQDRRFARRFRTLGRVPGALLLALTAACSSDLDSSPATGMPNTAGGAAVDGVISPDDNFEMSPNADLAREFFPGEAFGVTPSRVWRLSWQEYRNTVFDLLGVDIDPSEYVSVEVVADGYRNQAAYLTLDDRSTKELGALADAVAEQALSKLSQLLPCQPAAAANAACVDEFLASLLPRAYRRPVTPEELSRFSTLYRDASAQFDAETGIRLMLGAILRSPLFVFRTEAGDPNLPAADRVQLGPYELASALSYALLNRPADAELWAAAESGSLLDRNVLEQHVRRLLSDERVGDMLFTFVSQWLGFDDVDGVSKSPQVFPAFSQATASSMLEESRLFVRHVNSNAPTLAELLTASYSHVDAELANVVYEIPPPPGGGFQLVQHDPTERTGLLTLPAFLASHSSEGSTSVTDRGLYVMKVLACLQAAPPPPNVDTSGFEASVGTLATARERFAAHAANPACGACHAQFDPYGLALETHNAIGRFRSVDENNLPIDPSGTIAFLPAEEASFQNAAEMLGKLAATGQVHQCFTRQSFRYLSGRMEQTTDNPTLQRAFASLVDNGLDLRELMVRLIVSDNFTQRLPTPSP